MRQFELVVTEMAGVGGLVRISCRGPGPGTLPGQCCLALAGGLLRVPLFLAAAPEQDPAFYVSPAHALARLQPGDRLDLVGPCGRGFHLPEGTAHVLVLASVLDRLLPTIEQVLRQGLAVTVITPRSADLLPIDVEIHRGPLSAELAAWADVVLLDVSDPRTRARHIRALSPARGETYVQALFTPPMPCGVGACQACWVEPAQAQARKLACVEGPVFAL